MSATTFIQRIAEHIQSHYDLTRQELTVVFPNKGGRFRVVGSSIECETSTKEGRLQLEQHL